MAFSWRNPKRIEMMPPLPSRGAPALPRLARTPRYALGTPFVQGGPTVVPPGPIMLDGPHPGQFQVRPPPVFSPPAVQVNGRNGFGFRRAPIAEARGTTRVPGPMRPADQVPAMLTGGEGVVNEPAMELPGMRALVAQANRRGLAMRRPRHYASGTTGVSPNPTGFEVEPTPIPGNVGGALPAPTLAPAPSYGDSLAQVLAANSNDPISTYPGNLPWPAGMGNINPPPDQPPVDSASPDVTVVGSMPEQGAGAAPVVTSSGGSGAAWVDPTVPGGAIMTTPSGQSFSTALGWSMAPMSTGGPPASIGRPGQGGTGGSEGGFLADKILSRFDPNQSLKSSVSAKQRYAQRLAQVLGNRRSG
jgi:hypothetical protein